MLDFQLPSLFFHFPFYSLLYYLLKCTSTIEKETGKIKKKQKQKEIYGDNFLVFEDSADKDPEFQILNERFRFGIIPAGSTDAVVMWYHFFLYNILSFPILL